MARSKSVSWKTIFISCFITLCVLIYGNTLFVWRQTTIMITTNPSEYGTHSNQFAVNISHSLDINNFHQPVSTIHPLSNTQHYFEAQRNYNLYTNPYNDIAASIYLKYVKQKDYLSLSDCLSSIKKESAPRKCTLSKKISFVVRDVIGSGNHGKILSSHIKYMSSSIIPLNVDINTMNAKLYALKYSSDNETCSVLQFEYNIMKQIQSRNNMEMYYLTDLHKVIPWIEWFETNRFTRKTERKCILVMEQIENVKTLEGLIQKQYPPSFEYDGGLIPFLMNCYHDLMIALRRLHLFNYYHIDINGVNILIWPRRNVMDPRICYLIDYGGVFALDFDAKTDKIFTGKSHNYSPFAYYNLYLYEMRERTKWNSTKLNYFARKDNEYRIIVEILRMYLEYIELFRETFTDKEWQYIVDAKYRQNEIEHVTPVGINPNNETYIQEIWCLRSKQISGLRKSNLGTKQNQTYWNKENSEFLVLLDILENAVKETNAINDELCNSFH